MDEQNIVEPVQKPFDRHGPKWATSVWFWVILIISLFLAVFVLNKVFQKSKGEQATDKEKQIVQQVVPEEKVEKKNEGDFTLTGETKSFSTEELMSAEAALASGIKIDDPQSDWYKFEHGSMESDGKPNNANPYPLGWSDLKSLSVGADGNYIYLKFTYWGRFQDKAFSYNGDQMDGGSAKINYFSFTNSEGKKDWADLITPINMREQGDGKLMPTALTAMVSPMGKDANRETLFKTYSADGLFAGGPGTDYLLSAFPLSEFNLRLGDKVTFDCTSEVGSEIYHHEAIDQILSRGNEKFSDTIEYILGSNTYTNMPQLNENDHS